MVVSRLLGLLRRLWQVRRRYRSRHGGSPFVLGVVHGVRGADGRASGPRWPRRCRSATARRSPPGRSRRPRMPSCATRGSPCPTASPSGARRRTYERAFHAYGAGFTDRIRAFALDFPNPPDVVAHPRDEHELEVTLDWCDANGYVTIPYGGGSSVVWGVNPPDDCGPCVTIALDRLDRVLEIDEVLARRAHPGRACSGRRSSSSSSRAATRCATSRSRSASARSAAGSSPARAATTRRTTRTSTTSSSRCGCSRRRGGGRAAACPAAVPARVRTGW